MDHDLDLEKGSQFLDSDASTPPTPSMPAPAIIAIGTPEAEAQDEQASEKRSIGHAIKKTLSTNSNPNDLAPPPDGGVKAWTQVALVHLVVMSTWGFVLSFGVFQPYFVDLLHRPQSDVSWFGSIQIWLLFFAGVFAGRATDAGFFRLVFVLGSLFATLGMFLASVSTAYWHFFLSQGVCIGLGFGLQFCPTVALMSTYFTKKRAMAFGFAASGSATGGLIYPAIVRQLLPSIGFQWTMRVLGFTTLAICLACSLFLRTRIPPRKSGPLVEWAAFTELSFSLYAIGMFFTFWSLMFSFFYIVSFARSQIALSPSSSINLLLVMNGVGLPGRLIPNTIASFYTGPVNLMIPVTFGAAVLFFGWTGVDAQPGLFTFAVIYGFFSAGIMGLFPATLANLTTDLSKQGTRMGMGFSIVSLAVLTGPPLAGALIQADGGGYLAAQVWAGSVMMLGSGFIVAARIAATGWVLRVKI